jgi:glycosyltransferase involved in cell wall biosynthesis
MFSEVDISLYSILIINQTSFEQDLESSNPKIRVINSRNFGLSKSRNLAIENSKGDILLLADDDVKYLPGFEQIILQAYKKYDQASLISFQFLNENEKLAKLYPKKEGYVISSKRPLSSVEICFRKKDLISCHIRMNEDFGLGTTFPSGEEQLLKRDFLMNNLKLAFVAKPILVHYGKTSASDLGNIKSIQATTALKYIQYNNMVYFWLVKYVFFLFRHNYISFLEQLVAYRAGMKGISELKKVRNEN